MLKGLLGFGWIKKNKTLFSPFPAIIHLSLPLLSLQLGNLPIIQAPGKVIVVKFFTAFLLQVLFFKKQLTKRF